jgi:aminoglycoside phosphotransferase family enzyme/predicted kinase
VIKKDGARVGQGVTDNRETAAQQSLIRALQDPSVYPHAVTALHVIETHISWVILTGEYVYKIKKAVNFGFLDYSTLEKRNYCCREELRLNRRFAPQVYVDVVAIGGSTGQPSLQTGGEPIEYAVRMKQFPAAGLLGKLAAEHALTPQHIDALAELVPAMHALVETADENSEYGLPHDIHHWVMENFDHIRPCLQDTAQRQQLEAVANWCQQEFVTRRDILDMRRCNGFVRECHGDLHLGNLTIIDGRITPFDGIEFNSRLRWIDVMSETAFLIMDVRDRGYPQLSYRLLNQYLQHTGDYAGVAVLRYYLVYRALVRAKVAVLRQVSADSTQAKQAAWSEYASYMVLAAHYVKPPSPVLIITHGVSGSGKSFYAAQLAEQLGAIQIRSDLERKRLHGYAAEANTQSGIQAGIYSADASERTYQRLVLLARTVIEAGFPVIVDATFLQYTRREQFRQLSASLAVPFVLLHFDADREILCARIRSRQAAGDDPSEAGIAVLEAQLASQERLTTTEMADMLSVDSHKDASAGRLPEQLVEKIRAMGSRDIPGALSVADT